MLSIENPPVPDPSCPRKFPQLNSSCSDETEQRFSSSPNKLLLPELDLPNPSVDLPNFSIRHYVFTSRSKDIKKNWPFSPKNLQLCLKHGVKDVLPPFQHLDTVRDQSSKICAVEIDSLNAHKTNNFGKEPSRQETHGTLDSCYDAQVSNKLAESCLDINSCRSGEENFPSSTTTVSQCEIESVPGNRHSSTLLQTGSLSKASVEVEAADLPVTHKAQSSNRPSGKKCRLIVKFGGNSDRSSSEDIVSNCTAASEAMASKVCPVCKTFSFSSNTTLNAHIDQCLSVERAPKGATNSKLTRHRFKPRKTKLMVDIYATAQQCTLEELDRRNGRTGAKDSNLPTLDAQNIGTSSEVRKYRLSQVYSPDVGDVGPVYIDANGTKLRILSKSNDPELASKVGKAAEARKLLRGVKRSKYVPKKMKKHLAQKYQKYLKLAPQSKRILLDKKAHGCQIFGREEECKRGDKSCNEEQQMPKQSESSDSGTLRPWVCAKRRGFTKRVRREDGHQPTKCKWHLPQDLLVENENSFGENPLSESSHMRKFTNPSENLISSSGKNERMEQISHDAQVSDVGIGKKTFGRKRVGNLFIGGKSNDVDVSFPLTKRNANQLSKDVTFNSECRLPIHPHTTRRYVSNDKRICTLEDTIDGSNTFLTPISKDLHAIVNKTMKFSSCRNNVKAVNSQSAVSDDRPNKIKKCSTLEKSRLLSMVERDKEALASHSEVDQPLTLIRGSNKNQLEREERTSDMDPRRSSVLEAREKRGLLSVFQTKEVIAMESSKSASCYSNGEAENIDSSDKCDTEFEQKTEFQESARTEMDVNVEDAGSGACSKDFERSARNLNIFLGTELYKLSDSSEAPDNSLQSIQDYRRLLCEVQVPAAPTGPALVDDRETFSANGVHHDMMKQTAEIGLELDSEVGDGNPFLGVDPIPIPGPPGSFLPSPRNMGSEDFQGNSSLTTSMVQSSPDQHDMLDGDPSDSPISAADSISNSAAGRSDLNYCEPSSPAEPYSNQDKIYLCSTAARTVNSVENAGAFAANTRLERATLDGKYLKTERNPGEKVYLISKSEQPCCCQKKEIFAQGVPLDSHESQLLRRRKIATRKVSAMGKQTSCNSEPRPGDFNVRPEFVPLNSWPTSGSEKDAAPDIKPPAASLPSKDSAGGEVRFLARSDRHSSSPSASNPILRLMGKNLMVVNKDEDASMPLEQVRPDIDKTAQSPPHSRVCSVNIQNQDPYFFHHMISQVSAISSQDPHSMMGQSFDAGLSNSIRSHQVPACLPAGMSEGPRADSDFMALKEPYKYKIDHNFLNRENRPSNERNTSSRYPEKNLSHSSAPPIKEVIIINDVPGRANIVNGNVIMGNDGWRGHHVDSSSIPVPAAPSYTPDRLHPLSWYQSQGQTYLEKSYVVCNPNFRSRLFNSTPVTWVCSSEDAAVLQRNPFLAASSSTGHLSSEALYYS
ncbi:hypothetical protein K2173_010633 [Erythroxylum novogranatense]|uniref:Uncharacterized protein n=1 Tax=Erythroxylum novogranatense TaxID=1862640 RepID=A0AAV8TE44_9ROSI|nr:hypothetical protein K2173_010633 [Erythroxylum novogranatense]